MAEKIICVVGPTACGKTKLGVLLAKRYDGEVVSADSMQIYKGTSSSSVRSVTLSIFCEMSGIARCNAPKRIVRAPLSVTITNSDHLSPIRANTLRIGQSGFRASCTVVLSIVCIRFMIIGSPAARRTRAATPTGCPAPVYKSK